MTNLDAVTLFSVLTVAGSILLLAILAVKARQKIFADDDRRERD